MQTKTLPKGIGVGFKPAHFAALQNAPSAVAFIEVHAENYMGAGGLPHQQLTHLRAHYALSMHGVGLSIGGAQAIDAQHLQRVASLCNRYQPEVFSEHLAWSTHADHYYADLLPVAYTRAALQRVIEHVDLIQNTLQRNILIENPSVYLSLVGAQMDEVEFLQELARATGCGLLLDINNVVVSCANLQQSAADYLQRFPVQNVAQIHLAGHAQVSLPDGSVLRIDDHGSRIEAQTWALFAQMMQRIGPMPTLIEWDRDVPDWSVLLAEAQQARVLLDGKSRASGQDVEAWPSGNAQELTETLAQPRARPPLQQPLQHPLQQPLQQPHDHQFGGH